MAWMQTPACVLHFHTIIPNLPKILDAALELIDLYHMHITFNFVYAHVVLKMHASPHNSVHADTSACGEGKQRSGASKASCHLNFIKQCITLEVCPKGLTLSLCRSRCAITLAKGHI